MDRIFLWKPSPIPAEKISLSLLRHWYVKSIVISWFIHYVGFESVSIILLTIPIVPLTVFLWMVPTTCRTQSQVLKTAKQNTTSTRRKSLAARAVKFFLNWRKWTSQCVPAAWIYVYVGTILFFSCAHHRGVEKWEGAKETDGTRMETIKTEQTKAIRPNIHEVSERAKPTKQKKKFIYSKYDCV